MREADAKSPLMSTCSRPSAMAQRPRGLATLFALPGALATVDPRLAIAAGHRGASARWRARWRVHRAQALELLGEAVIDALAARLRRHLRGEAAAAG